jgi:hypothetical protein
MGKHATYRAKEVQAWVGANTSQPKRGITPRNTTTLSENNGQRSRRSRRNREMADNRRPCMMTMSIIEDIFPHV